MYVCACTCLMVHILESGKTFSRHFSSSTLWIPGIKLSSLSLGADVSHRAVSAAPSKWVFALYPYLQQDGRWRPSNLAFLLDANVGAHREGKEL